MKYVTLFVLCTLCIGCASMKKANPFSRTIAEPARAVAFWSPAVKPIQNGTQRGFAGRVYFYDNDSKSPVKVDGTVVVYAFDEDGKELADNKPDVSYVFSKDDLTKVYSKSAVGHSYSIWLPWDGGEDIQREVSLIVKYFPDNGGAIFSPQSTVYLPGQENQIAKNKKVPFNENTLPQPNWQSNVLQAAHVDRNGGNPIETANYSERTVTPESSRPLKMRTKTIDLTASR